MKRKLSAKKSVGNVRLGIFLYDGVYFIAGYTHQHIERSNIFLQGLKKSFDAGCTEKRPSTYSIKITHNSAHQHKSLSGCSYYLQ